MKLPKPGSLWKPRSGMGDDDLFLFVVSIKKAHISRAGKQYYDFTLLRSGDERTIEVDFSLEYWYDMVERVQTT